MKQRTSFGLLLGGIAFSLIASAASAQITASSATLRLNALANATQSEPSDPTGDILDDDEASWGTLLSPLSVEVLADAPDEGSGHVRAQGSAEATWDSETAGTEDFTGLGWSSENFSGSGKAVLSGTNWEYTFHTDSDTNFQVNYVATATGSFTFGLQGFDVQVVGGPEGGQFADFKDLDDPTTTDGAIFSLTAGNDYTVLFSNNANLYGGIPTASMDANFSWRIAPVPAPSSALTALLGLLPAATILWRRRK
jgi:hypothetical protein